MKEMKHKENEIVAARENWYFTTGHAASTTLIVILIFLAIFAVIASSLMRRQVEKMKKSGDVVKETQTFCQSQEETSQVYDAVLRFHIRANSDSTKDQDIKMKIKDVVMERLSVWEQEEQEEKEEELTKEDTMELVKNHFPDLQELVNHLLKVNGFDYACNIYLTREEFPIRSYGGLTFPAGIYDALRIDLGNAKGHNWWCMLYPSLCFVDATYSVVPEDSKKELSGILPDEDYESLLANGEAEVELHSGIWDKMTGWLGFH